MAFYWTLLKLAVRAQAQHRLDFAIGVSTALLMQAGTLSFFWVVVSLGPSLGGWAPASVLFLFGLTAIALGLSEALFNGIWHLPAYVSEGYVDRLLLYPVRSLPFVLMARPELHCVGNFVSGVVMVAAAFATSPPPSHAYLLLPLWAACASVIYTAALVVLASPSFRLRGPIGPQYFLMLHLLGAARYPLHIYPAWLGLVLTWLFPIGMATYFPAAWLEGAAQPPLQVVLAPLSAAGACAAAACVAWKLGIRSYLRASE